MEPRIQFAQTADGVSIAFATMGEGPPNVVMPNLPFSHLEKAWQVPLFRHVLKRGAERLKLVWYDNRGSGLSEHNVTDYSLEAHLLDLQAVVDHLSLDRFALEGNAAAAPVAITYAARHPERVSHLVLRGAIARGGDFLGPARTEAILGLMEKDWEMYTETIARYVLGFGDEELARQLTPILRECVTQEVALATFQAVDQFDASSLLGRVRSPTLVIHNRQLPVPEVGVARDLASRIPDARLAVVEDIRSSQRTIVEFLGEESATVAEAPEAGGFRTVLFTDVEGSTALAQRLGDARARELLREHERMVREALKSHGGAEVKTMGDGVMASFSSATKALECAIAMQRAFAHHNESAQEPIQVRVGLNAGEPIAEEDDLFGTAVIVAARIASKAAGGEILAANVVRELTAGKDFLYADRGDVALRGFEDPVRLYEVSWREKE